MKNYIVCIFTPELTRIDIPICYSGEIVRYDYFNHCGKDYRVMDRRVTFPVTELYCREVDNPLLEIKKRLSKIEL